MKTKIEVKQETTGRWHVQVLAITEDGRTIGALAGDRFWAEREARTQAAIWAEVAPSWVAGPQSTIG